MIMTSKSAYGCTADHCNRLEFTEIACNWREIPAEVENTVSVIDASLLTATAAATGFETVVAAAKN